MKNKAISLFTDNITGKQSWKDELGSNYKNF